MLHSAPMLSFTAEVNWLYVVIGVIFFVGKLLSHAKNVQKEKEEQRARQRTTPSIPTTLEETPTPILATPAPTPQAARTNEIVISQEELDQYYEQARYENEMSIPEESPTPEFQNMEKAPTRHPLREQTKKRVREVQVEKTSSRIHSPFSDVKFSEQAFVFAEVISPPLSKRKHRGSSRWI